jgi:uncharacterized protein (DUF2147 family)
MRNLKRALVMVSAVLAMSATSIAASHAGGAGKAAKAAKSAMPAKGTKTAVKGMTMKAVAKKGPGMCGTYMYWKGGKCMDARDKK